MADQMPAAPGAGPAPVPYGGADLSPEPPEYGVGDLGPRDPGMDVMQGVSGNAVQESGYAHDLNAGLCTPFYGGAISPIQAHGDADAGGRDDVADSVAAAVAAASARWHEHQSDTYGQGSTIGDTMTLPPSPLDPGVGSTGTTDPSGAFYDPPRNYGG
jgi:hypothetical protein